jgi:hypothetical protein
MNFKGKANRIDDYDLPRLGALIGVGEDELHAFMEVEAAGSGFDSVGRPKMLFEPHLFYRELGPKRDEAVRQGLAYAKWGAKPYPKESYTRLAAAEKIDAEAAYRSASWGLTQILAKWHADLGYPTAKAMVEAFMDDEANHLEATIKLLKQWGVDDDLKAHRWATVAKAWNGPQFAKHGYDKKLAREYARWSKIPDTAWPPKDWKPPVVVEPGTHTDVITVPGPEKGETTIVTVPNPVNEPAQPTIPTKRTGLAVLGALILSLLTAAVKYFGG